MGIGFKRSVRPGEWIPKFYDAYDLIPVESESWVNLRRRDTDPIMYKPSGGLRLRGSGGRRALLSNRQQRPALDSWLLCLYSLLTIQCLESDLGSSGVWPRPLCHSDNRVEKARHGAGPGSGVRDNNCYLFSITNTFSDPRPVLSVNCHHQCPIDKMSMALENL